MVVLIESLTAQVAIGTLELSATCVAYVPAEFITRKNALPGVPDNSTAPEYRVDGEESVITQVPTLAERLLDAWLIGRLKFTSPVMAEVAPSAK